MVTRAYDQPSGALTPTSTVPPAPPPRPRPSQPAPLPPLGDSAAEMVPFETLIMTGTAYDTLPSETASDPASVRVPQSVSASLSPSAPPPSDARSVTVALVPPPAPESYSTVWFPDTPRGMLAEMPRGPTSPPSILETPIDAEPDGRAGDTSRSSRGGVKTISAARALVALSLPAPAASGRPLPAFGDPSAPATASAVVTRIDLTAAGARPGCLSSSRAAAPATCGAAKLVPLDTLYPPPLSVVLTNTPGATRSGFG